MNQLFKTSLAFLFLFAIAPTSSEAAIQTNLENEIQALVIRKKNGKQRKTKKYQIFKVGESIIFKTKNDEESQKGQIIGFDDNQIVIVDEVGNIQKIPVENLHSIRRESTDMTYLSTALLLCFIFFIFTIIFVLVRFVLMLPVQSSPTFGSLIIPSVLALLSGVLGYIGFRKYSRFDLNEEWKAEIQHIEE